MSCGLDLEDFPEIKKSSFNGQIIADGMPPPKVTITENIDKGGGCSNVDGEKSVTISISGELICCDPQGKIDAREDLLSQFSVPCGDFEVDENIFENSQVKSIDVSSSNYRDNVGYSISLLWVDPDFPDTDMGKIANPSNTIQASEDDETVTITQTVSAQAAKNTSCGESAACECSMSDVEAWVDGQISSSAPTPMTIKIPSGDGGNCYEEETERDESNCSYSITRTWRINKKSSDDEDDKDLEVNQCRTVSTNYRYNKDNEYISEVSYSYDGDVSWNSTTNCEEGCEEGESEDDDGSALSKVTSKLDSLIDSILSLHNREPSSISRTVTESESPSGSYSISFEPPPEDEETDDDSPPGIKDSCNISASLNSDGIITVTVSGTFSADLENREDGDCRTACELVNENWDESKYSGKAQTTYNKFKEALGPDVLSKFQGDCASSQQLNPEAVNSSVSEDSSDCSKSYSFTYSDVIEPNPSQKGWSYSASVTKPMNSITIEPLLNGGYCVTRGPEKEGTINVSGSREAGCTEEGESFDADAEALRFASSILPGEDLREESGGCQTSNSDGGAPSSFNKTYKYGGESSDSNSGSGVNINNQGGGAPTDF